MITSVLEMLRSRARSWHRTPSPDAASVTSSMLSLQLHSPISNSGAFAHQLHSLQLRWKKQLRRSGQLCGLPLRKAHVSVLAAQFSHATPGLQPLVQAFREYLDHIADRINPQDAFKDTSWLVFRPQAET